MARILVIDDDAMVRNTITAILDVNGHDVIEAIDGEEGLRAYRQDPADLVITDVQMPIKTGDEVIRELRADFPDLKILALTAYEDHFANKPHKPDLSLPKPFSVSQLADAVNDLLKAD